MAWRGARRSQVVVPFGVGSIVEFEREALMPAGLDEWPTDVAEYIFDNRLARRLRVHHFLVPPPKPDRQSPPGTTAPIPHVRFPQWHFCPRCRGLKKAGLLDEKRPRCANAHASPRLKSKPPCASLTEKRRPSMLPLRFVAVCASGHIEDFPWNAWAHSSRGQALSAQSGCVPECLYFYATQLPGLSGLMVSCGTCGSKRSLMGSTSPGGLKGWLCSGNRPWLGPDAMEKCEEFGGLEGKGTMLALQRGASNLYFPEVMSSILIPPYSTKIRQILSDPRTVQAIEAGREDGKIPDSSFRSIAVLHNVAVEQLRRGYLEMKGVTEEETAQDEMTFRCAEFKALQEERRDAGDLLITRPRDSSQYGDIISGEASTVTLVEQLAETRALIGFTRIKPDPTKLARLSRQSLPWLPAFRVYGEGIFIAFDSQRLTELDQHFSPTTAGQIARAGMWGRNPLPVTPSFILLHTLSHLFIKRLSFEAGYGSSSIRERIYSGPVDSDNAMAGILLYTAAGDADGTLGGLVQLGKPGNLERIFWGALEDARWCASDPICIESEGQGPDALNLAACHACTLLPETSCEFQNRLLDRGLVLNFYRERLS